LPKNTTKKKTHHIVAQASTPSPVANIEAISQPDVLLATTTNNESAKTNITTNTVSAVETANTASSDIEKPIFDAAFLNNPQPSYPVFAKKRQQEGTVMLKVKVSIDGKAEVVELAESSGFSLLDDAAQQAVAKWQFIPARHGDVVVIASVIVPIRFALR
jgi:protein TonB